MTYSTGDRVTRPEHDGSGGAVVLEVSTSSTTPDPAGLGPVLLLRYDEGGAGYWPAETVTPETGPAVAAVVMTPANTTPQDP